jgi:hypothetical protein
MAAPMMVEERQARITEIRARQEELDTEFRGMTFTDDAKTEFEQLAEERADHERAIEELEQRKSYLAEQAQDTRSQEAGAHFQTRRPDVARGDDIYDLTTIRSSFANPTEARRELHDRAKRSIENATFADPRVSRSGAQEHIERLLDRDSKDGELGRIILTTGKPGYREAFVKYLGGVPLTGEEQRAFSLGSTGLPVPYTLDPTVLPVSNSVVNPLRAISSVEQIVGSNEWRGLTVRRHHRLACRGSDGGDRQHADAGAADDRDEQGALLRPVLDRVRAGLDGHGLRARPPHRGREGR